VQSSLERLQKGLRAVNKELDNSPLNEDWSIKAKNALIVLGCFAHAWAKLKKEREDAKKTSIG